MVPGFEVVANLTLSRLVHLARRKGAGATSQQLGLDRLADRRGNSIRRRISTITIFSILSSRI